MKTLKQNMKSPKYEATIAFSFGVVQIEVKPEPGFAEQRQALDAMLSATHTALSGWVIDNTTDPEAKNGQQVEIRQIIKDATQQIAEIIISVPTTENFSRSMFEDLAQRIIAPAVLKAARSYPGTRAAQPDRLAARPHPLTEHILPEVLEEVSRVSVSAGKLQTR